METFEIVEVDRDYNTITNILEMSFINLEEAEEWCRKESWTGYFYYVRRY